MKVDNIIIRKCTIYLGYMIMDKYYKTSYGNIVSILAISNMELYLYDSR